MQNRDYHHLDYTTKYHPRADEEQFYKDMETGYQQLNVLLYTKQEVDQFKQAQNMNGIYSVGTMSVSILAIIMHNKIPLIQKIQRKWPQFIFKCGVFLVPINILGIYMGLSNQLLLNQRYHTFIEKYTKYRGTGDLLFLNENLETSVV